MDAPEGNPVRTLLLVGVIAAGAAVLVTGSHEFSKDRILANQRARLLQSLHSVLDASIDENNLNPIRIEATDPELLGTDDAVEVFIIADEGRARAAIFASVAPDGYHAPIYLLIGISTDGRVTGVRVIGHRETPGLGDAIEADKSGWIRQFEGRSLTAPASPQWAVDEDGGSFDSITSATVTARAVVKAVHDTLAFFEDHKEDLFAAASRAELEAAAND